MNQEPNSGLVLWQDDSILVVNKPAGMLVNPGGFPKHGQPPNASLREILEPHYSRLWLVHRLDRDTSGVLVLARSADAHRALNAQFEAHTPLKLYHALVVGNPTWRTQTVDLALLPNGDRKHRTVVPRTTAALKKAKRAHTSLRVLERYTISYALNYALDYTLIQARPHTGRTHQIRAHLAALDLPILGDALYGGGDGLSLSDLPGEYRSRAPQTPPGKPLLARQALHARSLTLRHPITQQELRFQAPYPADLAALLDLLRQAAPHGPP